MPLDLDERSGPARRPADADGPRAGPQLGGRRGRRPRARRARPPPPRRRASPSPGGCSPIRPCGRSSTTSTSGRRPTSCTTPRRRAGWASSSTTTARCVGYERLFVADASVFPSIPHANTYLPTLMLAERLAARRFRPSERPDRADPEDEPEPTDVTDPTSTWRSSATARPVWPSRRRAGGPGWRSSSSAEVRRGRRRTGCGATRCPMFPDRCFGHVSSRMIVDGHRHHELDARLRHRRQRRVCAPTSPTASTCASGGSNGSSTSAGAAGSSTNTGDVDARLVVDATGGRRRRSGAPTQVAQTAFGIVVAELPPGFDRDTVTLMDLRPLPGAGGGPPTFCYVVPVADGWLVEETVLAGQATAGAANSCASASGPHRSRRAGRSSTARGAIERVVVPLDGPLPPRRPPVVAVRRRRRLRHPATGFSVAASVRAAPRVAAAIAAAAGRPGRGWPRPCGRRRCAAPAACTTTAWRSSCGSTRDRAGDVLRRLLRAARGRAGRRTCASTPRRREVSRTMTAVLRRLPWAMRRRLVVNPFCAGR